MKTHPINFAGGTALLLTDDLAAGLLLRHMEVDLGARPCCRQYVELDELSAPLEDAASILAACDRAVSGAGGRGCLMHALTTGHPYLMVLATMGRTRVCAYASRRLGRGHSSPRIVLDSQFFDDETLFDGTVVAGCIVRGDAFIGAEGGVQAEERWAFLADDCLAIRGEAVSKKPFAERRAALQDVVASAVDQGDGWATHVIREKRFYSADEAGAGELASRLAESRPYSCKGVLLRSTERLRKDILVGARAAGRVADGAERPLDGAGRPLDGAGRPLDGAGRPLDGAGRSRCGENVVATLSDTGMPDVYKASIDGAEPCWASVPTIALSQQIRDAFVKREGEVRWLCARASSGKLVPLQGGGPV
jgi:hypothetical protein